MKKKLMQINDGDYILVDHNDEVMKMKHFNDKESVIKYVNYLFDDEEKFTWKKVLEWCNNSAVDGDSYSAYKLIQVKNNELFLLAGYITIR